MSYGAAALFKGLKIGRG